MGLAVVAVRSLLQSYFLPLTSGQSIWQYGSLLQSYILLRDREINLESIFRNIDFSILCFYFGATRLLWKILFKTIHSDPQGLSRSVENKLKLLFPTFELSIKLVLKLLSFCQNIIFSIVESSGKHKRLK